MSELDGNRKKHFLENIEDTQVIITCTEEIKLANENILIYNVKSGRVYKK